MTIWNKKYSSNNSKDYFLKKGRLCAFIFFHLNWMNFIVPCQPWKGFSTNSSNLSVTKWQGCSCNLLSFRSTYLGGPEIEPEVNSFSSAENMYSLPTVGVKMLSKRHYFPAEKCEAASVQGPNSNSKPHFQPEVSVECGYKAG